MVFIFGFIVEAVEAYPISLEIQPAGESYIVGREQRPGSVHSGEGCASQYGGVENAQCVRSVGVDIPEGVFVDYDKFDSHGFPVFRR